MILLQWISDKPAEPRQLSRLRESIEQEFGMPTDVRVVNGPPEGTWDSRRRQRSSTKLLRWMLEHQPAGATKVLGITDGDLFIPVLTFVFGEAQVGGVAAVVSTARLHWTYDGQPASPELVEVRLLKECLHELGHTFGLAHCADRTCVMSRANSLLDIDQKYAAFCVACAQRLDERLRVGGSS
jgi:archaemetzincin